MSRTRAVGIDLGTTFSCAAWLPDGGRTTMIPNSDGDILTPSVVLFDDREVMVGKQAKKEGALYVGRYAECVKRDMGNPVYSQPICEQYMPPEVIQAWILKRIKADVVRTLGPDFQVVITVPAFFDEPRRKATADAGMMAGLPVLDVVNEPTAGALAFGEELGYLSADGLSADGSAGKPLTVLVYDLGGGTFDVTVLAMRPGDLRTLATDGDVRLGGRDWDMRLAAHAADAFIREHREDPRQNPSSLQRLLGEVEQARHTLSARGNASIKVAHAGSTTMVRVSRETFEQLTSDLLERTMFTTREVLGAAGLTWPQIDRVLLVGGATRMPMVRRAIAQLSGIEPDERVHPDEAVARGAAIYCYYRLAAAASGPGPRFQVTDVNSHSLGIEGIDQKTLLKRNAIIVPRNTPLPTKVTERFTTKAPNQRSVVVQVLEGESIDPSQCAAIGRTVIRDLPPGLPDRYPVEITYEYQSNGRLRVTGKVPGTTNEVHLELERETAISADILARWKQVVTSDGGLDDFSALIAEELSAARRSAASHALDTVHHHASAPAGSGKRIGEGRGDAGTRGRGDAEIGGRGDTGTRGRGDAEIGGRGDAGTRGRGDAEVRGRGDAGTRGRGDAEVGGRGDAGTRGRGDAEKNPLSASPRLPLAASVVHTSKGSPEGPAPTFKPVLIARGGGGAVAPARGRISDNLLNLVGYVVAAIVGLSLGYYVLCRIKPDANFLHLPPHWFSRSEASPPGELPSGEQPAPVKGPGGPDDTASNDSRSAGMSRR